MIPPEPAEGKRPRSAAVYGSSTVKLHALRQTKIVEESERSLLFDLASREWSS